MANFIKTSGIFNEKFIYSIDSIFDGFFILSKDKNIIDYKIRQNDFNLFFENKGILGKKFTDVISPIMSKENIINIEKNILENKPQLFETDFKINGEIKYYELIVLYLKRKSSLNTFKKY